MCPAGSSETLLWPYPVGRNVEVRIHGLDRISAGERADRLAHRIEDLEYYRRSRVGAEAIIDDRAVRRILAGRLLRRERSVGVLVAAKTIGELRLEEECLGAGCLRAEHPKRRH